MNENYSFSIRVTGVLIEDDEILVVKQKVSESRNWSLPGGRLERGETLEQALKREIKEETGLIVEVVKLLYICDAGTSANTVLHISFLIERKGGVITALPILDIYTALTRSAKAKVSDNMPQEIPSAVFPCISSYTTTPQYRGTTATSKGPVRKES